MQDIHFGVGAQLGRPKFWILIFIAYLHVHSCQGNRFMSQTDNTDIIMINVDSGVYLGPERGDNSRS